MPAKPFVYKTLREGVWGLIFKFKGLSGIIFEFESPPVHAACALLLLFVMAAAVAKAEAVAGGSLWRAWSLFRFSSSKPYIF
jgi:hypothetical protein